MKTVSTVAITVAAIGLGVVAAAGIGLYTGFYNVGADAPHTAPVYALLDTARQRAVAQHAQGIDVPPLGSHAQLLEGAEHFNAMCTGCHVPPGGHQSAMAKGLYPQPPNLVHSGAEMPPADIFWTIKHGIKASGMPAWGITHDDEALWAMTALIQALPQMSAADYQRLLSESAAESSDHAHHDHDHQHAHDEAPTQSAAMVGSSQPEHSA